MTILASALEDYDGKSKELLAHVRDGVEPVPEILEEAVALAVESSNVAVGATWLFRAWVESGVVCPAKLVRQLGKNLPDVGEHWARLHICQTMRSLRIPKASAAAFFDFLEACRLSKRPLVRAWGVDGLYRLAAQHEAYGELAEPALAAALEDPAASVRARARNLLAES